jgi:hypothetical protein
MGGDGMGDGAAHGAWRWATVKRCCDGCGDPLTGRTAIDVWVKTPTGLTCVWTHAGCEQDGIEGLIFQHGGGLRVERPQTARTRRVT